MHHCTWRLSSFWPINSIVSFDLFGKYLFATYRYIGVCARSTSVPLFKSGTVFFSHQSIDLSEKISSEGDMTVNFLMQISGRRWHPNYTQIARKLHHRLLKRTRSSRHLNYTKLSRINRYWHIPSRLVTRMFSKYESSIRKNVRGTH